MRVLVQLRVLKEKVERYINLQPPHKPSYQEERERWERHHRAQDKETKERST